MSSEPWSLRVISVNRCFILDSLSSVRPTYGNDDHNIVVKTPWTCDVTVNLNPQDISEGE